MTRTQIEWVRNEDGTQGYTLNPIKGLCPVACSYCYSRRLYQRFCWNPKISFEPIRDIALPKKPSRIFVGSTMELFGKWVDAFWLDSIFRSVKDNPQHTFIFLTKHPENLPKQFSANCWIGASVSDADSYRWAMAFLSQISAKVKFLSIEPFLSQFWLRDWEYQRPLNAILNWVIIGAQTPHSEKTAPKIEWIEEIVKACDKVTIPIFLKNNLVPLFNEQKVMPKWATNLRGLRQELPQ